MRSFAIVGGIVCCWLLAASADAQSLYDTGRQAWETGNYAVARDTLLQYRKEPYGRRVDVDFMLGTSGCRLEQYRTWGGDVLDWMLYSYSLTYASRVTVSHERDVCRGATTEGNVSAQIGTIVEAQVAAAGMTGYGKTFYWVGQKQPVASYPIRRSRAVSREELAARRISRDDPEAAVRLGRQLSPQGSAAIEGRFLLISEAGHSTADLESIGRTLNRFAGFLERTYDLRLPDHFVTVYLAKDSTAVGRLADRLHGLLVSPATIGYAFVDDASVVGFVEGTAVGTIMHELFHLLVRADFGDIPQWLDEGIASVYEVSGRTGDDYFGLPNWRGDVLRSLWNERPTIRELIGTAWFLFDDPRQPPPSTTLVSRFEDGAARAGGDTAAARRNAVTMATARYFLLYLDQQGELAAVLRAARERGFAELSGDAAGHAVRLVEETVGRSADALNTEFSAWFQGGGFYKQRRVLDSGAPVYVATASQVNVRTGPGTAFQVLAQLSQGERVAVFGESDDWYELHFEDGAVGYVSNVYFMPAPDR
jgi:hypothetical protein